MYMFLRLLNRSEFKNSAKFRQTFPFLCNCIVKLSLIFFNCCPKFINLMNNLRNFSNFYARDQYLLYYQYKFPDISQRNLMVLKWNCFEMVFGKLGSCNFPRNRTFISRKLLVVVRVENVFLFTFSSLFTVFMRLFAFDSKK